MKQVEVVFVFLTCKNTFSEKKFIAIIQDENLDNWELKVMLLKLCDKKSLYIPDKDDESYISADQIKGLFQAQL